MNYYFIPIYNDPSEGVTLDGFYNNLAKAEDVAWDLVHNFYEEGDVFATWDGNENPLGIFEIASEKSIEELKELYGYWTPWGKHLNTLWGQDAWDFVLKAFKIENYWTVEQKLVVTAEPASLPTHS